MQVTLGNYIYVFGGAKGFPYNKKQYATNVPAKNRVDATNRALRFSPGNAKWTWLPGMPTKKKSPACGVVKAPDGKVMIVVAGGYNGGAAGPVVDKKVHILHINSLSWKNGELAFLFLVFLQLQQMLLCSQDQSCLRLGLR